MEIANDLLAQVLLGREKRAERHQELVKSFHKPLISFTLNIPGANKVNPLLAQIHDTGINLLKDLLNQSHYAIVWEEARISPAGHEAFFIIEAVPEMIKKLTVELEEKHPLGRLFDFDVFDSAYSQVNRASLGLPGRTCLLCDQNAALCRRSRKHSLEHVLTRVDEIINNYLEERLPKPVDF